MNTSTKEYANKIYSKLKKQYYLSLFWFAFLNIFLILLISTLILLNIFAIKWNTNPVYNKTKVWFVILAILNSIVAVLTSIITFLKLKPKMVVIKNALLSISKLKDEFYSRQGPFKIQKNKDEKFINIIFNIMKEVN